MKFNPFLLERYFARYEFSAPHLLGCSDCESLTLKELLALEPDGLEQWNNLTLGYGESLGAPALRRQISSLYQQGEPMVFNGAQEAIFSCMSTLLHAGDQVIVLTPCYQSLSEIARAKKCKVIPWPLRYKSDWSLDLDFLKARIGKKTRMIVVNFPHNPTGFLPSKDEWHELVQIARQHGVYLFSDEVYRFLEYRSADRLEAACDLYEKGISVGALSKGMGLAGLRVAWLISQDRYVLDRLAEFKDYITLCNSVPSELLASYALKHREYIIKRSLDIIKNNLLLLNDFFERRKDIFEWIAPLAGPVAFPRIYSDGAKFCANVLKEKGVLLIPGDKFEAGSNEHLRIGFGRASLPEALAQLDAYLNEINYSM